MKKNKILIVEDEMITSLFISDCLESLGYQVIGSATSEFETLELLKKNPPDLILMDIMLGTQKSGLEIAENLYKNFDIPIVFLTAYSDSETVKKAVGSGSFGYILKPVEERSLKPVIEIALNKHREEKNIRERDSWLNAFIENIDSAFIATDLESRIRYINKEAEKKLNKTQKEVANDLIFNYLPISIPEKNKIVELKLNLIKKDDKKQSQIVLAANSDYGLIQIKVTPLKKPNNDCLGFIYELIFPEISITTSEFIDNLEKEIWSICSFCKKIKDEQKKWHKLEEYIQHYFSIRFSHCVCTDCAKKYYSDFLN